MKKIAFCSLSFFVLLSIHAETFKQASQGYLLDRDAREELKDIVREKYRNGEVARYEKKEKEVLKAKLHNFGDLGIPSRFEYRAQLRDLIYTLPGDIKDEAGNIITKRATVIKPLQINPLKTGLIFIDGTNQSQIDYAIKRASAEPFKIVLTKGSPYDLIVRYKDTPFRGGKSIPFYFDQAGYITKSLKNFYQLELTSVPASISQSGQKLLVEFGVKP